MLRRCRQSEEAKTKTQHKLYLSRESPEPTFDLRSCELSEIPAGVFSMCKVLRKEALLLNDNSLTSFKCDSQLNDLSSLRVLDLQDNQLSSLPDEISTLVCLQVLNLQSNQLKHIPQTIAKLSALQTLNLRDNLLNELPACLGSLPCLRNLDVTTNNIQKLPSSLCHLLILENLSVDSDKLVYPPHTVAANGTEAIMRYLCNDNDMVYSAPTAHLIHVLGPPMLQPASFTTDNTKTISHQQQDSVLHNSISQYEQMKQQKQLQLVELERQLLEEQSAQALLVADTFNSRTNILRAITEDSEKFDSKLKRHQMLKSQEKVELVHQLYKAEISGTDLMQQLVLMNEKAKKTEALLEGLENERIRIEQLFTVTQEESDNLRKKEVLMSIESLIMEHYTLEQLRQTYVADRTKANRRHFLGEIEGNTRIVQILGDHQHDKNIIFSKLIEEEDFQKKAFEQLLLEKDVTHHRITQQIVLIEQELQQITLLEIERKNYKEEINKALLNDKRQALGRMLIQLIEEKNWREEELRKRLVEMEEQKLNDQHDYWLIQYQRLLDRKPQSLIDMEWNVELAVRDILLSARAEDYIPMFARQRITIETLLQITDDDLIRMGVHELGIRKSILKCTIDYQPKVSQSKQRSDETGVSTKHLVPSAPVELAPGPESTECGATNRPREINTYMSSECVICLDDKADMIFMVCGHICCCQQCAVDVINCPMCRAGISMKVKLTLTV